MAILSNLFEGNFDTLRNLKNTDFGTRNPLVRSGIPDPGSRGPDNTRLGSAQVDDVVRLTTFLGTSQGLRWVGNQAQLAQIEISRKGNDGVTAAFNAKANGKTTAGAVLSGLKQQAVQTLSAVASAATGVIRQAGVNGDGKHFLLDGGSRAYLSPAAAVGPSKGILGAVQRFQENLNDTLGRGAGLDASSIVLQGGKITALDNPGLDDWDGAALNNGTLFDAEALQHGPTDAEKTFTRGFSVGDGGHVRVSQDLTALRGNSLEDYAVEGSAAPAAGGVIADTNLGGNINSELLARAGALVPEQQGGATELFTAVNRTSLVQRDGSDFSANIQLKQNIDLQQSIIGPTDRSFPNAEVNAPDRVTTYEVDGSAYQQSPKYLSTRLGILNEDADRPFKSYGTDSLQALGVATEELLAAEGKDIIPFEFNVYSPQNTTGVYLYFRALLESFQDDFSGAWNPVKYVGRGENFYVYQGFDRSVSFSFKVAAFSKDELIPLYNKLNRLAAATAPAYDDKGLFMKGTFTKLTLGDYLKGQEGFIEGVNISWTTDYPWEINVDEDDSLIVPHLLDVSIQFKPIHDFIPTSDIDETSRLSYIAQRPTSA